MKKILFILLTFSALGCSLNYETEQKTEEKTIVSITNWNLQTFFDSVTEGTEYSDFIKNSRWTSESYSQRLDRLCKVITSINSDIFVFEEIENKDIIMDISNRLTQNNWNTKKQWAYSCFAKEDDSSIGVAIFSRFPIYNFKTHRLDIRSQQIPQPSSRLILQANILADNKFLTVFANHWKSKSGGEYMTEIWRDWQEAQLAQSLSKFSQDCAVVILGDFNRNIEDFVCLGKTINKEPNILLRGAYNDGDEILAEVYSPWLLDDSESLKSYGSYYYEKEWERIDNIFGYGKAEISGFNVKAESPWANSQGIPIRFNIFTGEGYSDHLPIMCSVVF